MFPSHNGNDPISFIDQAFYFPIDDPESNQTSKQENNHDLVIIPSSPPPLSFFHFPSPPPFEDTTEIFPQQHHHDYTFPFQQFHPHDPFEPNHHEPVITLEDQGSSKKSTDNQIPRKKPSKKDRHSKINTARGLRDRRMRLSLEVAKRFFGLQDMLGFDKASKTVEWLLNQAKVEINKLAREKKTMMKNNKNDQYHSCSSRDGAKSASSTSECEGVSSLDEVVVSGNQQQQERVPKKKSMKNCRKSASHPLAKECRERARERARERTREKMRTRGLVDESKQCGGEANHNLSQLGSWNPFESDSKSHIVTNPSLDVLSEAKEQNYHTNKEHLESVEAMAHDDSFVIFSKWNPSTIFNSPINCGLPQDHLFAEFQSSGKPWEG